MLIHASCVAVEGKAVLLAGAPGIGKSDLALRLIDAGAVLVADDQTLLHCTGGVLCASPPDSLRGMMEIRHIGLIHIPFVSAVPVMLYVDLATADEELLRMPDDNVVFLLDRNVQRLRLPALAMSTPAKIRAALVYKIIS
jgi:serine kinase of HPr protein (carbohydrate metabolism regulator)